MIDQRDVDELADQGQALGCGACHFDGQRFMTTPDTGSPPCSICHNYAGFVPDASAD